MDDRDLEKRIREALEKENGYPERHKEEIWKDLEAFIHSEPQKGGSEMTEKDHRKKPGRKRWLGYGLTAALIAVILLSTTTMGQAAVKSVMNIFIPQKTIVEEMEGEKEDTEVELSEMAAGYIIYLDKERYDIREMDGYDVITPKPVDGMDLSRTYFMEISQDADGKPEVLAEAMRAELMTRYEETIGPENVTYPIEAVAVRGKNLGGKNELERYYFFENTKGGSFIVRQMITVEAEAGHGARFNNMLKEMRIVEVPAK
jgi:hypothetical protein